MSESEDEIENLLPILYSSNLTSKTICEVDCISQTSSSVLSFSEEDIKINKDFDNLITLFNYGKEQEVVKYIGERYLNKKFYTWIGQILLAVNPYEGHQNKGSDKANFAPSVKSLVHKAWCELSLEGLRKDQAIIISGDSGSGKTFSACSAIKHLFNKEFGMMETQYHNVMLQVWSTVPLLSAFGNACTSCNNNSSRFGKLLQLKYSEAGLVGCKISTYMLEKTRVAKVNQGEGNFHIFCEILDNLNIKDLEKLHLNKKTVYKLAPKIRTIATYNDIEQALKSLKIYEFNNIKVILAIILNLGNISFESIGDSYIVDPETKEFVNNVANLLVIPVKFVNEIFCTARFSLKISSLRNSVYQAFCTNKEECEDRRDSLIKYLYQGLFNWLVKSINTIINCDNNEGDVKNINILDLYGFEMFENNTFEQLCINYANERLLQFYAKSFLLKKQMELKSENLWVADIDVTQYDNRVSLIDGHVSIFGILNEECEVKRFNNDSIVNSRIVGALRGHSHFIGPLNDFTTSFSIKHYAGTVQYSTKGMLAKNRDKVPDDIIDFLRQSKLQFLHEIMDENTKIKRTTVANFKKSLDSLMETLNNCEVHYIKCLKPNQFKISGFIDAGYFAKQLESNAIFETFKINNLQKYSIRMSMELFIKQFPKHFSKEISQFFGEDLHMGNKFIYFTETGYYNYQKIQRFRKNFASTKLQRYFRKVCNHRNNSAHIIQRFFRGILYKRHSLSCETYFKVTEKSGDLSIPLKTYKKLESTYKISEFLKKHDFKAHSEGDLLSIPLEKVSDNIKTKPFRRTLFCGNGLMSYTRPAEIPVRLHTSKTCIKYSNYLPKSELPQGLLDIL